METPPAKNPRPSAKDYLHNKWVKLGSLVAVITLIVFGLNLLFSAINNRDDSPAADKNHAVVQLTGEGWDPAMLRVRKGTRVTWQNTLDKTYGVLPADVSGDKAQSAPYGTESIAPGQGYDHVFDQTGTFTFKEPQNPTITGTVVVVDE